MKNWKENNLSSIMEYPFDFNRYIEERLREISDLEEREFAKLVLAGGLSRMIEDTEIKYQQLEKQVYEELEIDKNHYETVMTIVKRDCYDPNNQSLYPLFEQDLNEGKLKQSLSIDNKMWIGTIFMEMDEDKIHKFQNSKYATGLLEADGTEERVSYQILPAVRYRNMIEEMYQIF